MPFPLWLHFQQESPYFSRAWMAFPGSEELSGDMSRICTGSSALGAWVYQQRCTSQSSGYLPKSTGRVGERRFLSLSTSQRISKAHILAAHLCRSPDQHTQAWFCAQPHAAAPRVALQMFTIHWVVELGVFLTPWACRMTQADSPGAACSHRTEGRSHFCTKSQVPWVVWAALP